MLQITVTDLTNLGYGVARLPNEPPYNGRVVFVPAAAVGDVMEIKIIKQTARYYVGRCERLITPSPDRVYAPCKVATRCGGCAYSHITYEAELTLKRSFIESAMRKEGLALDILPVENIGACAGYRNKVSYPLSQNGKIGYFAPSSHKVIEFDRCPLHEAALDPILLYLQDYIAAEKISIYDETTRSGLLRHIYLRCAKASGEIMVCLVLNGTGLPDNEAFCRELTRRFPSVVCVCLNDNRADTNVILGKDYAFLTERKYIEDTLCGLRFRITPAAFYQVNHTLTERLYAHVSELALSMLSGIAAPKIVDLFCGIGTIGLVITSNIKASRRSEGSLLGIELSSDAVENARVNAAQNGVESAKFLCLDADKPENTNSEIASGLRGADLVVLDPPRSGCAPGLIDTIANGGVKNVIYVSCDPATLMRDLKHFSARGYNVGSLRPFDMFPRTGHVESVVSLTK